LAASSRRASSACPRGEDPATSVARELLEETGYTVKNVRPAGVGPLQIDWPAMDEALLSEKQRERCKQFKGDQSHFFFGDVVGPPVQAVDPSGFKDVRFRRPQSLQKLFEAYSGPAGQGRRWPGRAGRTFSSPVSKNAARNCPSCEVDRWGRLGGPGSIPGPESGNATGPGGPACGRRWPGRPAR